MNTVIVTVLFCLLAGIVAAIFWPRRNTPEARAFAVGAAITALVVAAVNARRKSPRLR